ncbi:YdeI/OmpD-associated family protein [Emticicia sp. 17c]|uniref:YdeI/OmpD-associated family protein n=1 Tax=Emticicia sp. 17c TaxID=3127704 RepID=UPI00301D4782
MENQSITFKTSLLLAGKTATGIEVPAAVVEQLGNGKRPPVKVTINAYTYPSTVAVMGGVFMLPVSAEVREKAGISSGDTIEVSLTLDTQPRVVETPADFQEALNNNPAAKQFFEGLSNSNKKYYIGAIEQAKTTETRNRRIEKAILELEQQKKP